MEIFNLYDFFQIYHKVFKCFHYDLHCYFKKTKKTCQNWVLWKEVLFFYDTQQKVCQVAAFTSIEERQSLTSVRMKILLLRNWTYLFLNSSSFLE